MTPLAVVTGASSGIGLELARELAGRGYDFLINAEDDGISGVVSSLESLGGSVNAVRADLAKRDGVETLYREIRSAGRPVDAICINAGIGVGGPFIDTDLEEELNLVQLNVTSTVHLAKLVLRDMVIRDEGRVLFTSSIAAEMPAPFEAVYGASKAFVQSFSEALRNEFKDTGVAVTALQPGPTETNFFHRAGMDDTKVGSSKKDDAAKVAKEGIDAMLAGKDHVVAGSVMNAIQSTVAQVLPETATAQLTARCPSPARRKSNPGRYAAGGARPNGHSTHRAAGPARRSPPSRS